MLLLEFAENTPLKVLLPLLKWSTWRIKFIIFIAKIYTSPLSLFIQLAKLSGLSKMLAQKVSSSYSNQMTWPNTNFFPISLSWKVLKSEKFSAAAVWIFRTLRATKWQSKSTYVMGGSKLWQFFVCVLKLVNHWCNKFMPTPFDGPILRVKH